MTRILVQRGSGSSSSNQNRSSQPSSSTAPPQPLVNPPQDDDVVKDEASLEEAPEPFGFDGVSENCSSVESKNLKIDDVSPVAFDQSANADDENVDFEKVCSDDLGQVDLMGGFGGLPTREQTPCESDCRSDEAKQGGIVTLQPPSPPIPPPRPLLLSMSNTGRSGSSRRAAGWPTLSRASPTGSRPSSPRSHCEGDGYNSADERSPRFVFSYNEIEKERQFEIDIRRSEGLEVKRMVGDGNCLFRAVADQVYGDPELYDLTRQMCIDYIERERDHFSQFITEGFTSYSKRKRRDQVYGNNMEIQAFSEMYNRPIHIYSYSTEPINIFHGNYRTDMPPIRLSYHHGNHYNSLVDPRRLTVGAGLGFSSLHGRNAGEDQVKAAMNAQQEQLIDNALIAEGRFYSDMELTEKEIERMVMEASRAEYLSNAGKFNHQLSYQESSTSSAEPSSSGAARPSRSDNKKEVVACGLNSSVQMLLSMGFSYLQALEAYSIFGDDVDSMICYLLETSNGNRLKGKEATE